MSAPPPARTADAHAEVDVVSLADEYVGLCEAHLPSSVWTLGLAEDGPGEVVKQHLTRMLRFQHGARDVLSAPAFLAARTVPQIARAFRVSLPRPGAHEGTADLQL